LEAGGVVDEGELVLVEGIELGVALAREVLSEPSLRVEADGVGGIAAGRVFGES
jgi:hypothetical protein